MQPIQNWCSVRDSNPHVLRTAALKTAADTNFANRAYLTENGGSVGNRTLI